MNFTLFGNKHLLALSQLVRGTCKIAVEVDGDLVSRLERELVKPRLHPGVVKTPRSELPPQIIKALQRAIGDKPVKSLVRDCKQLNQYIVSRHPPTEHHEVHKKISTVSENIDSYMPPEQLANMTEVEVEKWQRHRERAIRRKLGELTYAWKPITYGVHEALVYALGRGAQEYGVLMHILHELVARDPQFEPRSYFDFGSGVGTAMWAASQYWKDSIFEYYNVDASREMHELSELILREGNEDIEMSLRNVYYRQFLPAVGAKYDLVVSSYSLFELPSAQHRKELLLNLWNKCDGYLILVEEGTRRGSELINEARTFLLRLKDEELRGHVFAPCPHDSVCPRFATVMDNTPCNFEVSYTPLQLGEIKSDTRTARYSYVVLKKGESQDPTAKWPRLVRPTLVRARHAVCRMCTADAKLQEIIFTQAKHGKFAYRCGKASRWGDRLPITIGEPFETTTKTVKGKGRPSKGTGTEDVNDDNSLV